MLNIVKAVKLVIHMVIGGATALLGIAALPDSNRWSELATPVAVLGAIVASANAAKAFLDDSYRPQRKTDKTTAGGSDG